ncbi:hypothetical protein ACFYYN_30660 [Streptomyces sp. NPDC001902]
MTARPDLPRPERVGKAADELLAEATRNGVRPSALTLAHRVGLSNTTFHRPYRDIVETITTARNATTERSAPAGTKRDTDLARRNAKFRRANRELTDQLGLALACVQLLAIENKNLRAQVEASSRVTHLPRSRGVERCFRCLILEPSRA